MLVDILCRPWSDCPQCPLLKAPVLWTSVSELKLAPLRGPVPTVPPISSFTVEINMVLASMDDFHSKICSHTRMRSCSHILVQINI